MPSYQIYVPSPDTISQVDPALLAGAPEPAECRVLAGGPDGGSGTCFFWSAAASGVHLDRQRWSRAGRYWIGTEGAVQPADLLRSDHMGGLPVTLCDGHEWLIPTARLLPHHYALDDEGRPKKQVRSAYQSFVDRSADWYERLRGIEHGGDVARTIEGLLDEAWSFAVEALALNYRLNGPVAGHLQLLDDPAIFWVIAATFELSQQWAIQTEKKTADPWACAT